MASTQTRPPKHIRQTGGGEESTQRLNLEELHNRLVAKDSTVPPLDLQVLLRQQIESKT